jgi:hypothetical protein
VKAIALIFGAVLLRILFVSPFMLLFWWIRRSTRKLRPRENGTSLLDRGEDSHRDLPVDAAYIGTRILGPVDLLHLYRRLLFALEVVRREAKLGENFFVRNPLPTALLEPGLRLSDCLTLVLGLGLVVDWGVRNRAGDGVEETLKHADRGGYLVRSKMLDQFVGMLFVCRHNMSILHRDAWHPYLLPLHCRSQAGPRLTK